jgi:hypothetical protein
LNEDEAASVVSGGSVLRGFGMDDIYVSLLNDDNISRDDVC